MDRRRADEFPAPVALLGGLDVIHPERRHFQFRGVGMSTGHHHKAVPYVAAIVGAILAVVCLIAWALN